jgi:hypothetical protein
MNKKITDLPLKTTSLAAGDLFEVSEDQGAGVFVSKKIEGSQLISTGVQSVTGLDTDNTDPLNPVVQIAVDGVTVTGDGTLANPLVSVGGGGSQFTYEIGQYVVSEGGVIAHRWLSTVPNGTPTAGATENYIVVDLNDLSSAAPYATLNVDIPGVESTYDGEVNTLNLIAAGAGSGITVGTAAQLCDVSVAQGQSDWYLPSIDELSKLYQNRWEIAQGLYVGLFSQLAFAFYWSSTENDYYNAWTFLFGSGAADGYASKDVTRYVRAVRKFSI